METFVRNVRDLDQSDRSALERVVGCHLAETQQVIVNIVNLDVRQDETGRTSVVTPPWANIYEGLSDEEVDRLDTAIRERADLTRVFK